MSQYSNCILTTVVLLIIITLLIVTPDGFVNQEHTETNDTVTIQVPKTVEEITKMAIERANLYKDSFYKYLESLTDEFPANVRVVEFWLANRDQNFDLENVK